MAVNCISIFLVTLCLVVFSIKKLIQISHTKHLFDEPFEARKVHSTKTPNLGGVAIFCSMMFTSFLFMSVDDINKLKYFIISSVAIFILGVVDDLVGVDPFKKIILQSGAAFFTTLWGDLRVKSLYGFFGVTEIPYVVSVFVSVAFILLVINAFNLIDGINGLAGSIGLLACLIFAYYFWRTQQTGLLFFLIAICGSLVGFLFYNRSPARIFMGDGGSLFLGYIIAVFSISFMESANVDLINQSRQIAVFPPAAIYALLIIPVFDTLRVFLIRLLKKKSPFLADRNHTHHRLLDLDLSHMQATGILLLVTIISLFIVVLLSKNSPEFVIFILSLFIMLFNAGVSILLSRKTNKIASVFYAEKNISDFKNLYSVKEVASKTIIGSIDSAEVAKVIKLKQSTEKHPA